jgi:site-specific recombinase
MTIDGEIMDGKRVKYLTKDTILANEYLSEIQGLKNWLDAYRGQIDGLKHELAVTTHFLNQVTHGAPPPNPWFDRIAELEAEVSVLREETDQTRRIAELEAELNTTRQELDQTRRLARVSGRELAAELRRRVWRRVSAKL